MTVESLDREKNAVVREIYHYACDKIRKFPEKDRTLLCMMFAADFAGEAVFLQDDFIETRKGNE